jgi:hypothetical protein
MKFQLTFKTNDVLDPLLAEYKMNTHCEAHFEYEPDCTDCTHIEDAAVENIEEIKDCAEKFIKYGELITIEFDTESQSAVAIPAK